MNRHLIAVINPGSEWVEIAQDKKTLRLTLADFLFAPSWAQSPVAAYSGGEGQRLLTARLCLPDSQHPRSLNEPTNTILDMKRSNYSRHMQRVCRDYRVTGES